MRIDHVIIGARRIADIRDFLWDSYGFGIIEGSRHEDGTQGWLVPFDTPQVQYLELLTPADEKLLPDGGFGRRFLERTADGPAFLNWAVHSDDIGQDAARVAELTGKDPGLLRGESVRADGQRFPWAEAAFEVSWNSPSHPFFLEYGNWPARRARVAGDLARAAHRVTPQQYTGIVVGTAGADLADWCNSSQLGVECRPASAESVQQVRISTAIGIAELAVQALTADPLSGQRA